MKNASQLISKLRMPTGADSKAKKPAASEDPDFDPMFEPGAEDEAGPSEDALAGKTQLSDATEEELRAELAKRSARKMPGTKAEEEAPTPEGGEEDEDDEVDPPSPVNGGW